MNTDASPRSMAQSEVHQRRSLLLGSNPSAPAMSAMISPSVQSETAHTSSMVLINSFAPWNAHNSQIWGIRPFIVCSYDPHELTTAHHNACLREQFTTVVYLAHFQAPVIVCTTSRSISSWTTKQVYQYWKRMYTKLQHVKMPKQAH